VAVRWHWKQGIQERTRNYALELFALEGCEFVRLSPRGATRLHHSFRAGEVNARCLLPLGRGRRQIVLRHGAHWGHGRPEQLGEDRDAYGLDPLLSRQDLERAYREVARGLAPTSPVAAWIPADIATRVGVHVRLTDKLVAREQYFDMDISTWRRIEAQGLEAIGRHVDAGRPLFLCSDDLGYRAQLVERIRAQGGDVAVIDVPGADALPRGFAALADFFALSRCERIVQMTKYSNFTLAAALVGGRPIEVVSVEGAPEEARGSAGSPAG
jgi:hypothetical protein